MTQPPRAGRLSRVFPRRWQRRTIAVLAGFLVLVLALTTVAYATVKLPPAPPLAQTTEVLAADGTVLGRLHESQNRQLVRLNDVSQAMQDALISAEDRNFYHHGAIDPKGTVRAMWADLRGRSLQGGSTITQQLVKNSWLDADRSVTRKLKEALLAIKLERKWSKRHILERYLNTVYFGRGAYGVQAASQAYFAKDAKDLTPPEAAMLAGMIRAPEALDPAEHPEAAKRRRNQVLAAMAKTHKLSAADAERYAAEPVQTAKAGDKADVSSPGAASFVEVVRQWAVKRYGAEVAYGGGLKIQTTVDKRLQDAAERAVTSVLDKPDDPQAALVAIDDQGAVRAMIGGRDPAHDKVNYALGAAGGGAGRQAGSTFKPFVLATAIEQGIGLGRHFPAPAQITLQTDSGPWKVSNFDNEQFPPVDLLQATAHSVNTAYAQLMQQVGPDKVVDLAHKLGVQSKLEAVPSLVLGTDDVSPIEMTSAYMTFARRGQRIDPYFVSKVTDGDGRVLFEARPDAQRALPAEGADAVNAALQGVIRNGTGQAASIGRPAAGKTGTTENQGDAWFIGYTPKLGAGVWMGYPDGQSHAMNAVHGIRVTGGSLPARIWQRFMAEAVKGVDTGSFVAPPRALFSDRGDAVDMKAPSTVQDQRAADTSTTSSSTSSTEVPTTTASTAAPSSTTSTTARSTTTTSSTTTTQPERGTTTTTVASANASPTTTVAASG